MSESSVNPERPEDEQSNETPQPINPEELINSMRIFRSRFRGNLKKGPRKAPRLTGRRTRNSQLPLSPHGMLARQKKNLPQNPPRRDPRRF